jgi:hypothetical protein
MYIYIEHSMRQCQKERMSLSLSVGFSILSGLIITLMNHEAPIFD